MRSQARVVYGKPEVSQNDQGWDLLSIGRYEEALEQFGAEATADPDNGVPHIGYALAAAGMDMPDRAIWAMRYAFQFDPGGLRDWQSSDLLQPLLQELITQYESMPVMADRQADLAFMIAALHYLLGQIEAAHDAITMAINTGDRKSSTSNLSNLIENAYEKMSGQDIPDRAPVTSASNTTPAAQGK